MNFNTNKSLWLWVAVGFLAYLILPWYAIQEANGLSKIPQVFANEQAGNGLMQAASFGRPWLWLGLAGLLVAAAGAALPAGRRQGAVLLAGGQRWACWPCWPAGSLSARAAGRLNR
jgi:iron(III) transport system permease protein